MRELQADPVRVLVKGCSTSVLTSWMGGPRTDFAYPRVVEAELLAAGLPATVNVTADVGAQTRNARKSWEKEVITWSPDVVVLAILRTHVHLLVRTAPRIDIPRLVQFLKGGSSYAASRLPGNILGLRWSREYSATMVSPKQLAGAIRYIEEQASHHPGEGVEGAERRAGKVDRAS